MPKTDIFSIRGGSVQANKGLYIRRRADDELFGLCKAGAFAYVLTPRQLGKSSLMENTAAELAREGILSLTVDLQGIGVELTREQWYYGIISEIHKKAKLKANRDRCTLFDTDKLVAKLEELYRGMVADYRKGNLPRPDLRNLEIYLEAGIEHDHEKEEMLGVADYEGHYRQALARRHWMRPIAADERLWTKTVLAETEAKAAKGIAAKVPERAQPQKRRKTGTRG